MVQVVLRSSEAISLIMDYYFPNKKFKITLSDEAKVTLELDNFETATEVFKLLLEKNLVDADNVEFINTTPNREISADRGKQRIVKSTEKISNHAKDDKHENIREQVLKHLCEISPEKNSAKEIAEKLQLKYQSVCSSLIKLFKDGEIDRDEKKRYFKKLDASEVVEKIVSVETDSKAEFSEKSDVEQNPEIGTSQKNPEDVATSGFPEVNTSESEDLSNRATTSSEDENSENNLGEKIEYTLVEKAKTMIKVFADEKNEEVLNYIFFQRKRNFSVADAQKKFPTPKDTILTHVLRVLNEKEIIILDEKFSSAVRYLIPPMWRVYANLLKNKEPMEEGAIRTAAELGDKEFQKLMKQALEDGIVEKTEAKRVTRYAVKEELAEK